MHSAAEAGSLPCVSKLNRSNPSLLGEADEAGDLPIDVAEVTLRAEANSTGETSHKTNKQTNKQTPPHMPSPPAPPQQAEAAQFSVALAISAHVDVETHALRQV